MDIRKTVAYEWFDSLGKPMLAVFLMIAFVVWVVMSIMVPAYDAGKAENELRDKLVATDPGRFALVQLRECQAGSGLFSERPEVDCIATVVTAAKLLKGEPFANDVSRSLAVWADRTRVAVLFRP